MITSGIITECVHNRTLFSIGNDNGMIEGHASLHNDSYRTLLGTCLTPVVRSYEHMIETYGAFGLIGGMTWMCWI